MERFKKDLNGFLSHLQHQQYNGRHSPQIILVSPIAHEDLGGFLPDPEEHNKNLEMYTREMRNVASTLSIPFVDLFGSTKKLMGSADSLTSNGIHLTDKGYLAVSEMMAAALDFPVSSWGDDNSSDLLKEAINKKNQHFFYRFKAQNGEYIYGRRREWAGGEALDGESRVIDRIVQRLDSVIWAGSGEGSQADL